MWLSSRYILFRLFVKINVFVKSVLICSMASSMAHNLDRRMLGYLGRNAKIFDL